MDPEREPLAAYRTKRDLGATPEPGTDPVPRAASAADPPRFAVQEHHARRLHWDLRLEHDGVLASWAIPNGIPPTPGENRLAVHTEDHPLAYLDFQGEIPDGQYGAGTMTVWDAGTFQIHEWTTDKVEISFHGERLRGRYGLFPIGRRADGSGGDDDWLIHRMDPPQDPAWVPLPSGVPPMLATAGVLPGEDVDRWAVELKWDGVRALAYVRPGRLRLESRNLNDVTDAYPEVRGIRAQTSMRELLLDGEIVAFDGDGRPSFEALQRRMHVRSPGQVRRLQTTTPVVYAIFDLLHLDGRSLLALPYAERRARLEGLGLTGPAWRVPASHPGGDGVRLLAATAAQRLEGLVAKRLDGRYEPGRRTNAWIKVKHTARQELVIGGWLPGEGRRTDRIGALLMGVHEDGRLRYAGRVGTGFTEPTLDRLAALLTPLRTGEAPFDPPPKLPANAVHVRPQVVAEIEFREWTSDGVMRAPSFKGLREDTTAARVTRETDGTPEALFDTVARRSDGTLVVQIDGRALKLTNWDKVLFPRTGFTKGDLIGYHARIAPVVLPHLRDRPLTLKRYPNGVEAPHFYEKQSPGHRPEWVASARIGGVDYTLCQDRATLIWLANLADLELHTSLSRVGRDGLGPPTMVVFDLDPGPPAGLLACVEVALVLRGMFDRLGLESVAKVSGAKGMQVHVPLNRQDGYGQTKRFARAVAEALERQSPELVVSRMTRAVRPGRVLVDWSQNDAHKTTVSVYSLRAQPEPTVSAPVSWEEVAACHAAGDATPLRFAPGEVLERVARDGDRFASLLATEQALPST